MNCRAGMLRLFIAVFLLCPLIAISRIALAADPGSAAPGDLLPRRPAIAKRVEFWTRVFTQYSHRQVLIHDEKYVDRVYAVLDVPSASRGRTRALVAAEKRRIRAILLRLHEHGRDPAGLGPEDRKIFDLLHDSNDPNVFRTAASRLHAQTGLRDRFAEGLRVSRRYLPQMEQIFRSAGLPAELTRLPLIESCFNLRAYSHKGAAGIWQFMPVTGRVYGLRIDRLIDERRDPIFATHAAARYLANAHGELGNWPLAITAYNHGTRGIAQAVRRVGSSDLVDLIERYNGRAFGFAGQNFYAEFLAALDIDRHPERYFGDLPLDEPVPTDELRLPRTVSLSVAAKAADVSRDQLAALNPSLGSRIVRGGTHIPRGQRLRLPAGKETHFEQYVASLPPEPAAPRATRVARLGSGNTHRVARGETLSGIAARYGTTVGALKAHNGIRHARRLRAGQLISIPGTTRPATVVATASPPSQTTGGRHRVERGQTLSQIADAYGTSVEALKAHNGIRDPRRLRAGQLISIPGAAVATTTTPSPGTTGDPHRVERGQTLTHIAGVYGTTVGALKDHNDISDARNLRVGQLITIPEASSSAAEEAVALPAEQSSDTLRHHRLRRGQTLSDIAQAYGTTVRALMDHNGIRNARRVRAGSVITIPADGATPQVVASVSTPARDGYIRHRVRPGQTLSGIAKKYGTSIRALKRHNGIRDARRLRARQVIKIPTG